MNITRRPVAGKLVQGGELTAEMTHSTSTLSRSLLNERGWFPLADQGKGDQVAMSEAGTLQALEPVLPPMARARTL